MKSTFQIIQSEMCIAQFVYLVDFLQVGVPFAP